MLIVYIVMLTLAIYWNQPLGSSTPQGQFLLFFPLIFVIYIVGESLKIFNKRANKTLYFIFLTLTLAWAVTALYLLINFYTK
jgi:hypothetical protein